MQCLELIKWRLIDEGKPRQSYRNSSGGQNYFKLPEREVSTLESDCKKDSVRELELLLEGRGVKQRILGKLTATKLIHMAG